MSLPTRDRIILWARAAGRCSFPDCRKRLVYDKSGIDGEVLLGEIAHIVARNPGGSRGEEAPPGGAIDAYENTILLCEEHHKLVDGQPNTYSVEKLVQFKKDHEDWVRSTLSPQELYTNITTPPNVATENVYSTLLPVLHIPRFVNLAPCSSSEGEVRELIKEPDDFRMMLPYIVRGGNLLSFCALDDESGPFRAVIDPYNAERHHADAWWDDPDQHRWYVELLNRSLNKLTGRKGLNLDKEHRRYYFEPEAQGFERSVQYTSIGGRKASRQVAWQPRFKHNNEPKNYWEHLAVGLRFHRVAAHAWCLSIRPERRFTRDGYQPLTPKGTGRRSTSKKSHMYNLEVLREVHFWRDYFSSGTPRIVLRFGRQSLIIGSEMLEGEVKWPPITSDMKRYVKTIYDDDLVSLADYSEAIEFQDEDALQLNEEPIDDEDTDGT